ncbi:MAG: ABC transporter ATP-binding protein [Xanthomonadales bacterium]|nr:ABC transporter ATP-binding protein [Xanthomonadales bacterium]
MNTVIQSKPNQSNLGEGAPAHSTSGNIASVQGKNPQHTDIPAIQVEAVDLSYGKVEVLKQLQLSIPKGQIIAILGPNGAGKTSLINILLGLTKANTGRAQVLGEAPGSMAAKLRLGVVLQHAELAENLSVAELIQLFRQYYPAPLGLTELLQRAGLTHLKSRRYGKLSGGEKRRVQFALALAGDPELIFLDEPTTGLDIQSRQQLWSQIRQCAEQGRTVVLTTHYLEEADQLAHRIVVMNQGQIIADGAPQAIKSHIELKQVRCTTHLPAQHLLLEKLARDPEVAAIQHDIVPHEGSVRYQLRIDTHNAEAVVRALLQTDDQLSDLEVSGAGLEQAFLALTNSQNAGETKVNQAKTQEASA